MNGLVIAGVDQGQRIGDDIEDLDVDRVLSLEATGILRREPECQALATIDLWGGQT